MDFPVLIVVDFSLHPTVIREDTLYIHLLKSIESHIVAYNVVHPGKCPMGMEKNAYAVVVQWNVLYMLVNLLILIGFHIFLYSVWLFYPLLRVEY